MWIEMVVWYRITYNLPRQPRWVLAWIQWDRPLCQPNQGCQEMLHQEGMEASVDTYLHMRWHYLPRGLKKKGELVCWDEDFQPWNIRSVTIEVECLGYLPRMEVEQRVYRERTLCWRLNRTPEISHSQVSRWANSCSSWKLQSQIVQTEMQSRIRRRVGTWGYSGSVCLSLHWMHALWLLSLDRVYIPWR